MKREINITRKVEVQLEEVVFEFQPTTWVMTIYIPEFQKSQTIKVIDEDYSLTEALDNAVLYIK